MQTKPKLLVIRGGALGDVLMMTPIIRELFNDYDGFCEIYVRTGFPDVFKGNPYVAGVNDFNDRHYDATYDLTLSYENNPQVHPIHAYGWSVFGNIAMTDCSLELFPSQEDVDKVAALDYKNYIVVHMRQHNWPSRNLRPQFYQAMIEQILATTDLTIVQVGGEHELSFTGTNRLINATGRYSIHEVKCLIDGARAFIGIDGGLIHVAACTDTPLISFFTSCKAEYRRPIKDSIKFYPIKANIDCYGCQADNPVPCIDFVCRKGSVPCIDAFSVSEVIDTLHQAIL